MAEKMATIYLDSGKVIGKVDGKVFKKAVSASKHFLRVPPAIAFDIATLEDAERYGALTVEVFDKDSSLTYSVALATIWSQGFIINRGSGEQIALRLGFWTVS